MQTSRCLDTSDDDDVVVVVVVYICILWDILEDTTIRIINETAQMALKSVSYPSLLKIHSQISSNTRTSICTIVPYLSATGLAPA